MSENHSDAFWDDLHEFITDFPDAWHMRAEQLIAAFEVLLVNSDPRPGISLLPTAAMLAGFAVECLMKGILVQENKAFDEKNKFTLATHKLAEFASEVGLELDADQRAVLERLQAYIEWGGRYPVPLRAAHIRPKPTWGGGLSPISGTWHGNDWIAIRNIITALKRRLPPLPEVEKVAPSDL
jgi:hypothetical protein